MVVLILEFGGFITYRLTEYLLPRNLQIYLREDAQNTITEMERWFLIIATLAFIGWCVSFIGLFTFKRWGRTLFLASNCIGIACTPIAGPAVYSGIAEMLNNLLDISIGVVMAISYFTPLFDERQAAQGADDKPSEPIKPSRDDPWGLDPGITPQSLGGALFQTIGRIFRAK
jgi:hypothetical protein